MDEVVTVTANSNKVPTLIYAHLRAEDDVMYMKTVSHPTSRVTAPPAVALQYSPTESFVLIRWQT
jgi:hypothetical protein